MQVIGKVTGQRAGGHGLPAAVPLLQRPQGCAARAANGGANGHALKHAGRGATLPRGAFRVVADGYVTADNGTGIVHCAPAFGEDDMRVCLANGVQLLVPYRSLRRICTLAAGCEHAFLGHLSTQTASALSCYSGA